MKAASSYPNNGFPKQQNELPGVSADYNTREGIPITGA